MKVLRCHRCKKVMTKYVRINLGSDPLFSAEQIDGNVNIYLCQKCVDEEVRLIKSEL